MNKKGKINEEEEEIQEKGVPLDISKWSIPVLKGVEELSVAAQNAGGVLIASKQQAEDILKNFAHARVPIVLVTNVKVSGGANISKKMTIDVRAANNLMVPKQMYITQVTTMQEWPEAPTITIEMNHGTIIVQIMVNKQLVEKTIWEGFIRQPLDMQIQKHQDWAHGQVSRGAVSRWFIKYGAQRAYNDSWGVHSQEDGFITVQARVNKKEYQKVFQCSGQDNITIKEYPERSDPMDAERKLK